MAKPRNPTKSDADLQPKNVPLEQLLGQLSPPAAQHDERVAQGEPHPPEPPLHLTGLPPDDPYLPGFMMTDDPDELPGAPAPHGNSGVGEAAPPPTPPQSQMAAAGLTPMGPTIDVPTEDFAPPDPTRPSFQAGVRYESRITILEAYQYPGNLKNAPAWVDRNWTGYASDYDALRGIEPGPALRVPTRRGDEVTLCRPGDYVVQQEVVLAHGVEPDVLVEVWARESFEKNFIPTSDKLEEELKSTRPRILDHALSSLSA